MKAKKQMADAIGILTVILGAALFMILMDVPFVGIPVQMAVIFTVHLVAGWYLFASEIFMRVDFPAAFWLKRMLGLLLIAVCLDLILRVLLRRKSKGTVRWRLKWSFGIAGMLAILFGISMTIHGAVAAMKWIGDGKQSAHDRRNFSAQTLHHMGAKYAEDSHGTLPDNLVEMLGSSGDVSPWLRSSALFPQASVWEAPEYWTWLGGVSLDGPEDVPVAFAPRLEKDGTRVVVFRGGMTEHCTEEEWQAALERWRQAVRTPAPQQVTKATP